MKETRNPQARQMADESMVRNLAAQAEAIWPQEEPLFDRYRLPDAAFILDLGCGTAEIASRLARRIPGARVAGIDLIHAHLARARENHPELAERLACARGDGFELPFGKDRFDLSVCRHMLQAVPEPERILAELVRVTRPGGWLHLIVEDYGMIQMSPTRMDVDRFWREGPRAFGASTGTDLHIGRRAYHLLRALPVDDIRVDYVVVDTLRVSRETFATIWEAWRDGYSDAIAEHTAFTRDEVHAFFEDMIACMRAPDAYAVWQVPVVSGVVSTRS